MAVDPAVVLQLPVVAAVMMTMLMLVMMMAKAFVMRMVLVVPGVLG
jgi:hypothetical protein